MSNSSTPKPVMVQPCSNIWVRGSSVTAVTVQKKCGWFTCQWNASISISGEPNRFTVPFASEQSAKDYLHGFAATLNASDAD